LLALTSCRESAEQHIRKGHVFFSNRSFDDAEKEYARAVEIDPENAIALEGIGNVWFERHHVKNAIGWYEKAAAADPRSIQARHRLAIARTEAGDLRGALEPLIEAMKLDPTNTFAHYAVGNLYQRLGELANAEQHQLEVVKLDPDHRAGRFALAQIFVNSGRLDDAERELTRLRARGSEALAEYGFARLEAKRGKFPEAAKHLERVLELGVTRPAAVLEDEIFAPGWSEPAMQAVRAKLEEASKTQP
jgi:tetratricopeptide (TPR) repeat protein